jgi:predicted ATPase/DNA-binding SARP family transcriptional activator
MGKQPASPVKPSLRIRLLGPGEITVDGRVLTNRDWSGRRARSLLLLLAGTPGHRLHREQIIDHLWPESELDAGANALYKALHALRRTLQPNLRTGRESSLITVSGNVITLGEGIDLWLDVDQFTALIAHAGALPEPQQRPVLRTALDLYRGEFIADERYAEWPIPRREALRAEYERAILDLAVLDLAAGEPLATTPWLEALLAQEPTAESAHRALMRAYQAAGQRSLALRQYERCRDLLDREYDDTPEPETIRLADAIREAPEIVEDDAVIRAASARYRSLPSVPTRTVGRQEEIADVASMLEDPAIRLVTITGTGGIGKTRLVTEVATSLKANYPDGAGFVPLASVNESGLIYSSIATALQLPEHPRLSTEEVVTSYLEPRTYLLVLDNLEQIVGAGAVVARLLEACPGLTILATSRHPLRIRAEHLYRLDILDLPSDEFTAPDRLEHIESTALFVQHLRAQRFGYTAGEDDAAAIADLCVRLDGLPLAIELAAARCYDLAPAEVLAQFNHRARIHVLHDGPQDLPDRHQTLQDLVLWSYNLLTEPEQVLFRRLAVFAGGAELDALEAIGGESAIALANALATKSLVQWTHVDGTRRLVILETIREVAAMLLDAEGEHESVHFAHVRFYAELIANAFPQLRDRRQLAYFNRYERDLDNIRAALEWSRDHHSPSTLTIAAYVWPFWFYRSHIREGLGWLECILPLPATEISEEHAIAAQALTNLYERAGKYDKVIEFETIARRYWEKNADPVQVSAIDRLTSVRKYREGKPDEVLQLNTQALEISRNHDDSWGHIQALVAIASIQMDRSQFPEALASLNEALDVARANEDSLGQSYVLTHLGAATYHSGDIESTLAIGKESERLARLTDNRVSLPWSLLIQMGAAYEAGQFAEGLILANEAVSLFDEVGDKRNAATARETCGTLHLELGNLDLAARYLADAIDVIRDFGFESDKASCIFEAGRLAAARQKHGEAIVLFAANKAIRESIDLTRTSAEQVRFDRAMAGTRAALEPSAAASAWARGEAMSLEEGLDFAREACERALYPSDRVQVAS